MVESAEMIITDGKLTGKKIQGPYTTAGLSPAREGVYYVLLRQTKAGDASYTLEATSK